MLSSGTAVRIIDAENVRGKLLAAAPNILANNRQLVGEMLQAVRTEIEPGTPLGPGHFGYHLRDTYRIEVTSKEVMTSGTLSAAAQGYWREFGTRGSHRRRRGRLMQSRFMATAFNKATGGGERAGMFATQALNRVRRLISAYYGRAQWWHL